MRRNIAATVTLVVVTALVLALAGMALVNAQRGVRLTVWTQFSSTSGEYATLKAVIDDFAARTGNQVELIEVPWDELTAKIAIASPAGEGPDLIATWPHDWIGQWAKQELLMPLPANVLGAEAAQYIPSSLAAVTYDGALYGLPVSVESVALVYNKALVPEPPKTFVELVATAKRLTTGDRYGFLMPLLEQYHTYGIVRGFGGYIFRWDGSQYHEDDIGLASEGAVAGFSFLRDLYVKERIFPEAVADRATHHAVTTGLFEEGKVGMQINGPWVISGIKKAGIDYGVAVIPPLPNGSHPRPFIGIQFVAVNSYTRHTNQAIELAKAIAGKNAQELLFANTGRIPTRKDVLDLPALQADPDVAGWVRQAELGEPMPNIPEMQAVWSPWGQAMDVIIPGQADVASTLEDAVRQIKAGIARMRR